MQQTSEEIICALKACAFVAHAFMNKIITKFTQKN